eukprot:357241-Chlamydomonas_euryale.AAC.8
MVINSGLRLLHGDLCNGCDLVGGNVFSFGVGKSKLDSNCVGVDMWACACVPVCMRACECVSAHGRGHRRARGICTQTGRRPYEWMVQWVGPYTVKAGARQGCVIVSTLFNAFVGHVLQEDTASCWQAVWPSKYCQVGQCMADRSYLSHWHLSLAPISGKKTGTYVCRRFGIASWFT